METDIRKDTHKRFWSECLLVLGKISFSDGDSELGLTREERNCRVAIQEIFRDYCPVILHADGIDVYESTQSQEAIAVLFGKRYILCTPQDGEDCVYYQCGFHFDKCGYREISQEELPEWFRKKQFDEQWVDHRWSDY